MIKINLTPWELKRIIGKMEEGPQEDVDKELMLKLWAAQRRLKRKAS